MTYRWSRWRLFPDPRRGEFLIAPIGPGVYELRLGEQAVLFGKSKNVAYRMTSLLPPGLGAGVRTNSNKRRYIAKHLGQIEYRCRPCGDLPEATACERAVKTRKNANWHFET